MASDTMMSKTLSAEGVFFQCLLVVVNGEAVNY